MLKALRKKETTKRIFFILALIIIPAFVFWGAGGASRSRSRGVNYAGKISGRNVSYMEYQESLNAVKNQAIMQFGDNLAEVQKFFNFEQEAWNRLLLLHEAKRRKITVSDKEVVELIEKYPFFQRKGRFEQKAYNESLQYLFRSPARVFEEQTRQNLMIAKLFDQLTADIKTDEEEIKEEYRKYNEEISLFYLASIPADFARNVSASETEIKNYFQKYSLQFKQPLSFNLEYLTLESEDKIKEVASRLKKKEDLNKIAKNLGVTLKETGLFAQTDAIPGIGWSPEISAMSSNLKVGQLSPAIKADKYYYIFRLKERKEPYIADFEKIKDKVREGFIKDESLKLAKVKIEAAQNKLKELYLKNPKSVDFNKAAKESGLKSDSTILFKYGSYIEGIGASDNFWLAAKNLKENEFSDVISAPSGFYIVKLKSRVPMDEKKFEGEKEDFIQKLLWQKKQEYFAKFTDELSRQAMRN